MLSSQQPARIFLITRSLLLSLAIALIFSSGCGTGASNMSQGSVVAFAFVTNSGSGTVSAFAVSSNGSFTPVSGASALAGSGAEFMAFDTVHKLLFVSNQNANTVSAFSVNITTGMLTAIPGSPFASGARPTGIVVDAAGKFVFVANQADSSISAFNIAANGSLSPIAGSPFATSNPFGLAINPAGTLLFASNFPDSTISDLNTVSAFQISANGALSAIPSSPFATAGTAGFASVIGIAADPGGKFLFAADHMSQAIVPFSIASTGALSPLSALPSAAPGCSVSCHNNPLRLTVHPNDRFLYATNVQAGTVAAFSIANGALTPIAEVATGAHPFGVALDPTGNFLFVVNKVDNTISAYSVDSSTGTMSPLKGSPFFGNLNAPTDIVVIARQ